MKQTTVINIIKLRSNNRFYKNRINIYDVQERDSYLYLKIDINDFKKVKTCPLEKQ